MKKILATLVILLSLFSAGAQQKDSTGKHEKVGKVATVTSCSLKESIPHKWVYEKIGEAVEMKTCTRCKIYMIRTIIKSNWY